MKAKHLNRTPQPAQPTCSNPGGAVTRQRVGDRLQITSQILGIDTRRVTTQNYFRFRTVRVLRL